MSKEAMQKMAESVSKFLPKDFGFTLLVFPFGSAGTCNYISNANRADVIKSLREAADRIEKNR